MFPKCGTSEWMKWFFLHVDSVTHDEIVWNVCAVEYHLTVSSSRVFRNEHISSWNGPKIMIVFDEKFSILVHWVVHSNMDVHRHITRCSTNHEKRKKLDSRGRKSCLLQSILPQIRKTINRKTLINRMSVETSAHLLCMIYFSTVLILQSANVSSVYSVSHVCQFLLELYLSIRRSRSASDMENISNMISSLRHFSRNILHLIVSQNHFQEHDKHELVR